MIQSKFNKLRILKKNFGLQYTINYINAYIYMRIFKNKTVLYKAIEGYFEKNFADFIETCKTKTDIGTIADDYRIWVCWLQGEDKMPEVVKLCYKNLCNKLKDKIIVLITLDNLEEYIELPDYIYDKYKNGNMLPAHFSDIIRCGLLAKYGGMWIDSTIYVTDNIKQHLDIFDSKFYTHKINGMNNKQFYSAYRWGPFLLGTKYKNNDVMVLMYEFLKEYWKKYDIAIDYLIWDYILGILYKNNIFFKNCIDDNKENNLNLNYFNNKLNEKCNIKESKKILSNNYFFKITYKEDIDFENNNTNFAYLKRLAEK